MRALHCILPLLLLWEHNTHISVRVSAQEANIQPRIVGGEDAEVGQFPYYVDMYTCGGVLIHPEVVLSAGHCGYYAGAFVLVSGYQWSSTKDGAILALVVDDVRHPDYNRLYLENDYFLHRLDSPVDIGSNIVLRLNDDDNFPIAGQTLTTMGLGLTKVDGSRPKKLQHVDVQYIPNDVCNVEYMDKIYDNMICAGVEGGGKDSCKGDSGGPLVSVDGDVHTLVGTVSWGEGCADADAPGVYARTSSAIDWIRQVVCDDWALTADFCLQPSGQPSLQPSGQPSVPVTLAPTVPQPTNNPTESLAQSLLAKFGNDTFVVDLNTTDFDSNSTNSSCFDMEIQLQTDRWPQENALTLMEWSLVDEPIMLLNADNFNASTAYSWNFCLDTNQTCAILNFTDIVGDGLTDDGYFSVLLNGNVVFDEWNVGFETVVVVGADCVDG